jgi:hypothetical protein
MQGAAKFSDAIVSSDGKALFLVPATARFVVRVDLETGKRSTVGDDLGTKVKSASKETRAC